MGADYYSILGVLNTATAEEIRRAYLRKAKLFHPDIYTGSDGDFKFKVLNEAYSTLINPEKRRRYDFKLKYGTSIEYRSQADKDRMRRYSINYEVLKRRREEARHAHEKLRKKFRIFDRFIFWSLLILGFTGLIFGIVDAIVNLRFQGIIFSMIIAIVIIYTFRRLRKSKKHS
jgi:curved DNA-binding protein CbpA